MSRRLDMWLASVTNGAAVLDPTTLALTGLYRGSYGGAPWASTASAGTSGGRNMGLGVAPATGTTLNGFVAASFNGTTMWLDDTTNTADAYITTTAYRVSMLIKPASLAAPAAFVYMNPGLLTEGGGNWGIVIDTSGVHVYHSSATVASSAAALTAAAWSAVDVVFDGAHVTVSVNGVAGTPGASTATGTIAGALLKLGTNFGSTVFYNGEIEEVDIAQTTLSTTTPTAFKAYYNSRYGLAL